MADLQRKASFSVRLHMIQALWCDQCWFCHRYWEGGVCAWYLRNIISLPSSSVMSDKVVTFQWIIHLFMHWSGVRERLKSKMASIRKVLCYLPGRNDGVLSSIENLSLLIKAHICVIHISVRRGLKVLCCSMNTGWPVPISTSVCCP